MNEKQDFEKSLAEAREFKIIAMRMKFLNELLGYVIATDFEDLIDDIKHLIGYLDCLKNPRPRATLSAEQAN